jgi:hypothetical protein
MRKAKYKSEIESKELKYGCSLWMLTLGFSIIKSNRLLFRGCGGCKIKDLKKEKRFKEKIKEAQSRYSMLPSQVTHRRAMEKSTS